MPQDERAWIYRSVQRAAVYAELTALFKADKRDELKDRLEAMSPLDAASAVLCIFHRLDDLVEPEDGEDTDIAKFSSWIGKISREREEPNGEFCCEMMETKMRESCWIHGRNCVDVVMDRLVSGPEAGRFGIPIHDGRSSLIVINYCPWCGTKLKPKEEAP